MLTYRLACLSYYLLQRLVRVFQKSQFVSISNIAVHCRSAVRLQLGVGCWVSLRVRLLIFGMFSGFVGHLSILQ